MLTIIALSVTSNLRYCHYSCTKRKAKLLRCEGTLRIVLSRYGNAMEMTKEPSHFTRVVLCFFLFSLALFFYSKMCNCNQICIVYLKKGKRSSQFLKL